MKIKRFALPSHSQQPTNKVRGGGNSRYVQSIYTDQFSFGSAAISKCADYAASQKLFDNLFASFLVITHFGCNNFLPCYHTVSLRRMIKFCFGVVRPKTKDRPHLDTIRLFFFKSYISHVFRFSINQHHIQHILFLYHDEEHKTNWRQ